MKRINVHFTDTQIKKLKEIADKTETTFAWAVRAAVRDYIEEHSERGVLSRPEFEMKKEAASEKG